MILIFYLIITLSYVLIRQDMNKIGLIKVELLNESPSISKLKFTLHLNFLCKCLMVYCSVLYKLKTEMLKRYHIYTVFFV